MSHIGLLIVCSAIAVCIVSCSQQTVELQRLSYEAKQTCFDNGGSWNMWTSNCGRLSSKGNKE